LALDEAVDVGVAQLNLELSATQQMVAQRRVLRRLHHVPERSLVPTGRQAGSRCVVARPLTFMPGPFVPGRFAGAATAAGTP